MKKLILALVALIIATTAVFAEEEEKREEIWAKIEREYEECKDHPFDELVFSRYKTAIKLYQIAKETISSTDDHIEDPELRRGREAEIMLFTCYISDIKEYCQWLDERGVKHTHWEEIVDEQHSQLELTMLSTMNW